MTASTFSETEAEEGDFMALAFAQARMAAAAGDVPVGAVLVHGATGVVTASAHNEVERDNDPSAHAEILVLRRAGQALGVPRFPEHDLYVTLEPCPMCAAALSLARVRRIYFSAYDEKGGGVDHGPQIFRHPTCHHRPDVFGGIQEEQGRTLIQDFFRSKR